MSLRIRPMHETDLERLVELSLLAWASVFDSFKKVLGPNIYPLLYPSWQKSQREVVEKACVDEEKLVWVGEVDGTIAGFLVCQLDQEAKQGEVYLLAVDPSYQNQGIGTELNLFALEKMREQGMQLAVVSTGGDPGHAPARRCYEKAGYTALPLVRYYKDL